MWKKENGEREGVDFKETTNLPVGGRDGGIDFIQRAQCTMHNARLLRLPSLAEKRRGHD